MGDEELNFTEDEASDWADDPRNQDQDGPMFWHGILVCVLVIAAVLVLAWLAGSSMASNSHTTVRPQQQPVTTGAMSLPTVVGLPAWLARS